MDGDRKLPNEYTLNFIDLFNIISEKGLYVLDIVPYLYYRSNYRGFRLITNENEILLFLTKGNRYNFGTYVENNYTQNMKDSRILSIEYEQYKDKEYDDNIPYDFTLSDFMMDLNQEKKHEIYKQHKEAGITCPRCGYDPESDSDDPLDDEDYKDCVTNRSFKIKFNLENQQDFTITFYTCKFDESGNGESSEVVNMIWDQYFSFCPFID